VGLYRTGLLLRLPISRAFAFIPTKCGDYRSVGHLATAARRAVDLANDVPRSLTTVVIRQRRSGAHGQVPPPPHNQRGVVGPAPVTSLEPQVPDLPIVRDPSSIVLMPVGVLTGTRPLHLAKGVEGAPGHLLLSLWSAPLRVDRLGDLN